MDKKEEKLPTNIEHLEKELNRPVQPGDRIVPIGSWKDCYDLIYLTVYRLFSPNIPPEHQELTKEEVDKRIEQLEKEEVDGHLRD
jgi:hypothetical protein